MRQLFTFVILGVASFASAAAQEEGKNGASIVVDVKEKNENLPVSDQELTTQIRHTLESSGLTRGLKNVTVEVRYGVVNLGGSVGSTHDKNLVEEMVKKIAGVKQVKNSIVVNADKQTSP